MPLRFRPSPSRPTLPLPTLFLAALLALFALPASASAQDEDPARERWVFKGELTSVLARGNSESLTMGVGTVIRRRWERDALRFEAGGVRVETGRITRRAVGTEGDFAVEKEVDTEKTAEAVFARGRYQRTLSERFFLYGGVDWLRNTFAGIDSRTLMALGGGTTWADSDRTRFETDFAVTYTFEEQVVENPFTDTDFAGLRVGWEYWRQVTGTAEFESHLTGDLNLKETEDQRVDFTNALTVDVNDIIALKPSLQVVWRNQPALSDIPLFTAGGAPTGTTVQAPLEKVDTFFRLALVLTF